MSEASEQEYSLLSRQSSVSSSLLLVLSSSTERRRVSRPPFTLHCYQDRTIFLAVIDMDSISPRVPGCFPNGGNNFVYVDFVVLMVFETCACLP